MLLIFKPSSGTNCFALAEKLWQVFNGRSPHTQLCCSSHKCILLTNVAPFKKEINWLSGGIRFIAKKLCYDKVIIDETQIPVFFVLSLYIVMTQTLKGPFRVKFMESFLDAYFPRVTWKRGKLKHCYTVQG